MTDIIKQEWEHPLLLSAADQEKFHAEVASEVDFLPSIKLMQATNKETKDPSLTPKPNPGDFFLTQKNRSLGPRILVCIVGTRSHALCIQNGKKTAESFDPNSPIFKQIQNTPDKGVETMVMWSKAEYLCWLPEENEYGILFPGKKHTRPQAAEILIYMTPPQSRFIEATQTLPHTPCFSLTGKVKMHGPVKSSYIIGVEPIPYDSSYLPDKESMEATRKLFTAPVQNEPKVVTATSTVER